MVQRRHHYETAFEQYLRLMRMPFVAVDEARRTLLPDDARFRVTDERGGEERLKSFDLVLYGEDSHLIVEVKGRKIARRPRRPGGRSGSGPRLESWVTQEDVRSLQVWEALFGEPFVATFIFVFWCEEQPPMALFEETFEFRGRWYALRAIPVRTYAASMKQRSPRWRTVHLSGQDFDRLSAPLCGRVPGGRAVAAAESPVG